MNPQTTPNYTDYRLASDPHAGPLNLLKFHSSNKIDLSEFPPPVRLHRKRVEEDDPAELDSKIEGGAEDDGDSKPSSLDSKDKKTLNTALVDATVIAPYGNAAKNKTNLFRKKTRQVYQGNPEARKVREQEKQPWVLEDYDGTQSWQGKLEGGQQSNYVMLVFADEGFRVVPASKWYKFTPKIQYTTLTLDEAEEQISKQQKKTEQNDRWLMRRRKTEEEGGEEGVKEDENAKNRRKLKLTDRKKKPQIGDVDEMDFEEVFQDDEEGGFLPELQDEEAKESMERQKREAQKDRMSDEEAEDEQNINLTRTGKQMRKLVRKMEKNTAYESDEERDPYAQSGGEEEGSDMELEEIDGIQKDRASTSGVKTKKPTPPVTKAKVGKSLSSNAASTSSDVGKRKLKPSSHVASSAQPKKPTAISRSSSSTTSVPKSGKSSRASSPLNSIARGNSTPIHSSSSSALAALRAGKSASPPPQTSNVADSKRKRQLLSEEDPTDSQAGMKKVKVKLGNSVSRDRSMSMSPPPPSNRGISVSGKANSPSPSPATPPGSTVPATGEINPVQFEQELIDLIGNNTFSTKDLILKYKKVLRNASSKELVVGLIKKVASSHSGYLTLRDEYKNKISR